MYIYGVAIAIRTLNGVEVEWKDYSDELKEIYYRDAIIDTAFDHSEEYIRAYELNKDTITILRETLFNLGTTPISYYYEVPDEIRPHDIYPKSIWLVQFYEMYFDEPLLVTDSFYVGMSQYLPWHNQDSRYPKWPLYPTMNIISRNIVENPLLPWNDLFSPDSNCAHWSFRREHPEILTLQEDNLWMFPIVDSGSWNPDSTEAIASMPPAPTVTVSPNPTTGKIFVQSENNISHIEIYNSQGQLVDVHDICAYSCEFDLSDYRSGVYFLHIYTSGGTVSKRVSLVR